MKFWLIACVALVGCQQTADRTSERPLEQGSYLVQVTAIHDGDTFSINLPGLPPELQPVKVRVRGVDTPEIGGKEKCDSELVAGERAHEFTKRQLNLTRGRVVISKLHWDKYGGRIDADVYVGNERDSLTSRIIEANMGRQYLGGKRDGWC